MSDSAIIEGRDGELYQVEKASPTSGGRVLVLNDVNGEDVAVNCNVNVGDKVIVIEGHDGEDYAVKGSALEYDAYKLISEGFDRAVANQYEEVNLGTFTFNWDGTGKIYLLPSIAANPLTDYVWVDDSIYISTTNGTIYADDSDSSKGMSPSGVYYSGTVEITSILERGSNEVNFLLKDIAAAKIGCSSLYIVQVI